MKEQLQADLISLVATRDEKMAKKTRRSDEAVLRRPNGGS